MAPPFIMNDNTSGDINAGGGMALKFTRLSPLAEIPRPLGGTGLGLLTTGEYETRDIVPGPGAVYLWKTGLAVEPPPGHYVEICPAGGLYEKGWMAVDPPVAIDPAFRGEIVVPLLPLGLEAEIEVDSHEGWASGHIVRDAPGDGRYPDGEGGGLIKPSTLVARLAVRRLYEPEVIDTSTKNKA
jgi:hypothetical protein